jgi:hypothetical protein
MVGAGFRPALVPIAWIQQTLVCEAPAPKNTFDAKI